ncbi:DUF6461 domain-containing protein [Kribbella sp. HUAS MG21]|uniref:DUF6461 domain-containing protein n=1 Tax=Kribbella sp. HUAS MG21 TaxID=3160966 RepID=A0AAU7TJB7_9ACTN
MNAHDYSWFAGSALDYGYCMTFVQGLTPGEVLQRIDGEVLERRTGLHAFIDFADRSFPWPGREDRRSPVGAVALDGWSMLLERNGFLGVSTGILDPLSVGTQVVSHYKNVDGEDRFCWMIDRDLRVKFEPFLADRRSGSDPDGLVDVMRQVGFDLRGLEERDASMRTGATFALTEHLTGLKITKDTLDAAEYLCAKVPDKH